MSTAVETKRTITHYVGRSRGLNRQGVWIIGPVLIDVHVVEYLEHRSSSFVFVDGRHQCGQPADHPVVASVNSFISDLQPVASYVPCPPRMNRRLGPAD